MEERDKFEKQREKRSIELLASHQKNNSFNKSTQIKRCMDPETLYQFYINENDISILNDKQNDILQNYIQKKNYH